MSNYHIPYTEEQRRQAEMEIGKDLSNALKQAIETAKVHKPDLKIKKIHV